MQDASETNRMRNRGLLTRQDRRIVDGDVEADASRWRDLRYNVEHRMERIEADLDKLQSAGESDLVETFYGTFGKSEEERRIEQLEQEVRELRKQVDVDDG